jgi:putative serine protease PepD
MTDARQEPDKTEATPEPGAQPEPVWARPTSPEDPWSAKPAEQAEQADPAAPVAAPEPVSGFTPPQHKVTEHVSSSPVPETQPSAERQPGEPAQPVPEIQPVAQAEPAPPTPPAAPAEVPQPAAETPAAPPQYSSPEYSQPQPEYPQPQYPQYTAPQGFGSPHGPVMEEAGTAPAAYPAQPYPPQAYAAQVGPEATQTTPVTQATPANPTAAWYGEPGPATQPYDPAAGGWPPPLPGPVVKQKGRGALIALIVGASLLAGAIGGVAGGALWNDVEDSSSGRNPTISLPTPAPETGRVTSAVTTVANAVLPSVVLIKVATATESGTGSGFVIDAANGYILTNNHVVTAGGSAPATNMSVVFQDGTQVKGKVVGRDASYDLAVVKVQAKGLKQLQLGDSSKVRVGDPVVAIGAPLGLQGTVTTGIVSALNRPVAAGEGDKPAFINAIQTDAAINPGNSGGPLVDSEGNVIAVNSAIARSPDSTGSTSGNIGLGFAIPSNQARRTAEELIRTGKAEHPIIGVSLDSSYQGEGVKVSDQASSTGVAPVTKGGPADQAGIKAGDIITKIGDQPVTEPDELIVAIRAQRPGDTVTLTVKSGNSGPRKVQVKLSASSD